MRRINERNEKKTTPEILMEEKRTKMLEYVITYGNQHKHML
jgi:hypothetical protein